MIGVARTTFYKNAIQIHSYALKRTIIGYRRQSTTSKWFGYFRHILEFSHLPLPRFYLMILHKSQSKKEPGEVTRPDDIATERRRVRTWNTTFCSVKIVINQHKCSDREEKEQPYGLFKLSSDWKLITYHEDSSVHPRQGHLQHRWNYHQPS